MARPVTPRPEMTHGSVRRAQFWLQLGSDHGRSWRSACRSDLRRCTWPHVGERRWARLLMRRSSVRFRQAAPPMAAGRSPSARPDGGLHCLFVRDRHISVQLARARTATYALRVLRRRLGHQRQVVGMPRSQRRLGIVCRSAPPTLVRSRQLKLIGGNDGGRQPGLLFGTQVPEKPSDLFPIDRDRGIAVRE